MYKWIIAALLITVGCTVAPPGPSGDPSSKVWTAGDSIVAGSVNPPGWPAMLGFPVFNIGMPQEAFSIGDIRSTIEETIAFSIFGYGRPDKIYISGGVNDQLQGATPEMVVAAMEHLDMSLVNQGVEVVWVTPPRAKYATPVLDVVWAWMLSKPNHRDCGRILGETFLNPIYDVGDGTHINDTGDFLIAQCVSN